MADQKISALLPLAETDVQAAADVLPIADVSTAETKKITASALVGAAMRGMAAGSISGTLIQTGTVGTAQLADGAITNIKIAGPLDGAKLAADSVTAREIAINAVTASELADGAVDTAAIVDLAVTNSKIAAGVDGAKLTAGTVTSTQLAANSVGATQLADGAVDTAAVQDGAVVSVKIANAAVGTTQLADGGVTTAKVADGAITGVKLAAGSVDDSKISGVAPGKLGTAAAGAVLAGPAAGAAGAVSFRALQSTDLPIASAAAAGVVKPGSGLSVAADGALSISAVATAGTSPVVTYNSAGQVTAGRALTGADLPLATSTAVGGIKAGNGLSVAADGTLSAALSATNLPLATSTTVGGVKPGAGLSVDGSGALRITNAVTAGTFPVITYDAQGSVTAGRALTGADLPDIDAAKITNGTLPAARIGGGTITRQMLADYALGFIQESNPPVTGIHAGAMWLQESTGQLRVWNSNSWFPVGFGRLSAENLRYCGTFNAATGAITGVTQFGTTEGFKLGDQVPSATDKLAGVYFVVATPGNGTAATAGVTYDNGDWILCNGASAGWTRIDTLSSGSGGGGGASHLDDLLDVTLTAPVADSLLQLGSAGQWVNVTVLDMGSY